MWHFDSRDSSGGTLIFSSSVLGDTFTAGNTVTPGGIHPKPAQATGDNGPVTDKEVEFNVHFATPFMLPADHYFFVPQVQLDNGDFLWLSAPKSIVSPGTPFLPDLQSWTRDTALDPDWLRVGTDIVGGASTPTFHASFSITGVVDTPEPASMAVLAMGLFWLTVLRRERTR